VAGQQREQQRPSFAILLPVLQLRHLGLVGPVLIVLPERFSHTAYTMRTGFRRIREIAASEALHTSVPMAITWLNGRPDQAPPGSLGGGEAALALADLAEAGLTDDQRQELMWFAVRVGVRRLADAEHWLGQIGLADAAVIAGTQARLVGGLQYPLVAGDNATVAKTMRDLAPTYRQLCQALSA
jgi:hypothetical protein